MNFMLFQFMSGWGLLYTCSIKEREKYYMYFTITLFFFITHLSITRLHKYHNIHS